MQSSEDRKQPIKKLGELLLESGIVSEGDLAKAIDNSKKNFQSLGKVLVSTRTCSQTDIDNALEIQKVCKIEGMGGDIAVRALNLIRSHYYGVKEALQRVGWNSESYNPHQEPADIAQARAALNDLKEHGTISHGQLVEKLGDAFLANKLPARAEMQYQDAVGIYQAAKDPNAVFALSEMLGKLGSLATAESRAEDAKRYLAQGKEVLDKRGQKDSKAYGKLMHLSAEFLISNRNYSGAEQHYIDCFNLLEAKCGLEDPEVIGTIRKYVEIVNKAKPTGAKAAAAKWSAMSHESHPDKVTLGELLKGARLVDEKGLTAAWQYSKDSKVPLGRAFVDLKLIAEAQMQMALKTQLLVRNNEVTAQLGVWILLYATQLRRSIEDIQELFNCGQGGQSPLSDELKAATEKMQQLEATLPANHPDLGFGHAKQAMYYFYRQQYFEADNHFKRGLEILRANPDVPAENMIEVLDNYSQVKQAIGDTAGMLQINKLAVLLRSKQFGKDSVPYARGVEKLALCFCAEGDHHTALSMLDKSLAIIEALHSAEDREMVSGLELRGDCLSHLEDFPAAEECLVRSLRIAEASFGKEHAVAERVRKKLIDLYKSTGQLEKAKAIAPTPVRKNTLSQQRGPL